MRIVLGIGVWFVALALTEAIHIERYNAWLDPVYRWGSTAHHVTLALVMLGGALGLIWMVNKEK